MTITNFLQNEQDIANWLNKHNIIDYEIIKNDDNFIVNVDNDVMLIGLNLDFIPVKFGRISGTLDVGDNNLQSLDFCPQVVNGDFDCSRNNLNSLEFFPTRVEGKFSCDFNNLSNIDNLPLFVGTRVSFSNNEKMKQKQFITDFHIAQEHYKKYKVKQLKYELEHLNKNIEIKENKNKI